MEETDRKLTLNGLVETALFVEELPRACDFYKQVLGLSKVKASDTGCVFRVADQRYLLIISRKAAHTPNKTARRERLAKHDVDLLSEISWETGARSLYFRDPDGHMIELATAGIWEAA